MLDVYSIATQGQFSTSSSFILGSADGFYTFNITERVVVTPERGQSIDNTTGSLPDDQPYYKVISIDVDVEGKKYTCETVVNDINLSVDEVSLNNEKKQVTVMMKAADMKDHKPAKQEKVTVDLIEVLQED